MTNTLQAEERTLAGRKVKTLRTAGKLPGNIFGKDVTSRAVSVDTSMFAQTYKDAGETGIVELDLGTEKVPVLIYNLQVHPVSGEFVHVDFRQVNLKEKIEAQVPVELTGESPAEKAGMGILVQQVDEVTVEALPADLPEKYVLDISSLEEVGSSLTVADLLKDPKVEIKDEAEKIIAMVEELQKEEEPLPVAPAEGEEGAETPAEGATEGQADGDAAPEPEKTEDQ